MTPRLTTRLKPFFSDFLAPWSPGPSLMPLTCRSHVATVSQTLPHAPPALLEPTQLHQASFACIDTLWAYWRGFIHRLSALFRISRLEMKGWQTVTNIVHGHENKLIYVLWWLVHLIFLSWTWSLFPLEIPTNAGIWTDLNIIPDSLSSPHWQGLLLALTAIAGVSAGSGTVFTIGKYRWDYTSKLIDVMI